MQEKNNKKVVRLSRLEKTAVASLAILSAPVSVAIVRLALNDILTSRYGNISEVVANEIALKVAIPVGLLLNAPSDGMAIYVHWKKELKRMKRLWAGSDQQALLSESEHEESSDHDEPVRCLSWRCLVDKLLSLVATAAYAGLTYNATYSLFKNVPLAAVSSGVRGLGMWAVYHGHGLFTHHHHHHHHHHHTNQNALLTGEHSSVGEGEGQGQEAEKRSQCAPLTFVWLITVFAFVNHGLSTGYSLDKTEENFINHEKICQTAMLCGLFVGNIVISVILGAKDAFVERDHAKIAVEEYQAATHFWRESPRVWVGRILAVLTSFTHVLPVMAILSEWLDIPHVAFWFTAGIISSFDVVGDTVFHGYYIREFFEATLDAVSGLCRRNPTDDPDEVDKWVMLADDSEGQAKGCKDHETLLDASGLEDEGDLFEVKAEDVNGTGKTFLL